VTEQNSLATQLDAVTYGEGLHGRCSSLGQLSQSISGEIGAFAQLNSTLCNLHAESHTSGASTFLTILFGGEFENI
jgi:hypothetical protein